MQKHWLKSIFLLFITLCSTAVVSGQEAEPDNGGTTIAIDRLDNSAFPTLTLDVIPLNRFGVPLPNLTPEDFQVLDSSGELLPTFVPQGDAAKPTVDPDRPISIVVALDVSGTVVQNGQLDGVKQAAIALRQGLAPTDEMGVLFFSEAADGTGVIPFDEGTEAVDPREIRPSIDGGATINFINAFTTADEEAGTPLTPAILRSLDVLARDGSADRRALIVVTDGVEAAEDGVDTETEAAVDLDLLLETANRQQIPIFMIGLGDSVPADQFEPLATGSGGVAATNVSPDQLFDRLVTVTDQLKTNYRIAVETGVPVDESEQILTVELLSAEGTEPATATFQASLPLQGDADADADNEANIEAQPVADGAEEEGANRTFLIVLGVVGALLLLAIIAVLFAFLRGRRQDHRGVQPFTGSQSGPLSRNQAPLNNNLAAPIPPPPVANRPRAIDHTIVESVENADNSAGPEVPGAARPSAPPTIVPVEKGSSIPTSAPTLAGPPADVAQSPPPIQASVEQGNAGAPLPKTEVLRKEPALTGVLFNPETGEQLRLAAERTTIGRKPENDILLTETSVSGQHAAIERKGDQFTVYDLGAANPVMVNGSVINAPTPLSDGDQLTFGRLSFIFKLGT